MRREIIGKKIGQYKKWPVYSKFSTTWGRSRITCTNRTAARLVGRRSRIVLFRHSTITRAIIFRTRSWAWSRHDEGAGAEMPGELEQGDNAFGFIARVPAQARQRWLIGEHPARAGFALHV